jgi:ABC-type dipeptide/oligopeptide/nickel transport system permease component
MLRFIARRLLIAIPVIYGLITLVFFLMHLLPGDAVQVMLTEFAASAQDQQRLRHNLGLDKPLLVQYKDYIFNVAQGDFGRSLFSHQKVTQQILHQLPATIQLSFTSILIAVPIGILIGVVAAVKQNSWVDRGTMLLSLFGVSMPNFWLGLVFIYIFAVTLNWLPAAGSGSLKQLILPALALSAYPVAVLARLVRASMLEVLRQDYVVTARAKGMHERRVIFRHALKNALIPVITIIGLQFGFALGGAVITETVFARQGVGQLAVTAIQQRDMPLVQGTVIMVGITTVLANLLVDVAYGIVDPRIRYS